MILFIDDEIQCTTSTSNIDLIKGNIAIMGWDYQSDIGINLLMNENIEVLTAVHYVGRYICILQINPDQTNGMMIFIDHTEYTPLSLKNQLEPVFGKMLYDMIEKNYKDLLRDFSPLIDRAVLKVV